MKLSELINHVGDAAIEVQWLHESSVMGKTGPNGATITFATDPAKVIGLTDTEPEFAGLVAWLPMALLPEQLRFVVV